MSISLGQILIFQAGLKPGKSTYCDLSFKRLAGFFESASLMNEVILQIVSIGFKSLL